MRTLVKMFKFTRAFLLFVMLLASVRGTDQRCPNIQEALAAVKSDMEGLRDVIKDLVAKLEEQFEWPPSQISL